MFRYLVNLPNLPIPLFTEIKWWCARVHTSTRTRTHTHTRTHARTRVHTHTHTHSFSRSCLPQTYLRTHARTHAHANTQTNKQTNKQTHTHTHTRFIHTCTGRERQRDKQKEGTQAERARNARSFHSESPPVHEPTLYSRFSPSMSFVLLLRM